MRASGMSRALHRALLLAVVTAVSAGAAVAQTSPRTQVMHVQKSLGSEPRTVSRTGHASGAHHKASSFAPHPTTRRVFGDPIQPPIVNKAPPPKAAASTSGPK